jgi:hypothetical protein
VDVQRGGETGTRALHKQAGLGATNPAWIATSHKGGLTGATARVAIVLSKSNKERMLDG